MLNVSREYGSFSAKCTLEMKAGTVYVQENFRCIACNDVEINVS